MKNLLKVKGVLRREFKDTKELHLRTRESLAAAMAKYAPYLPCPTPQLSRSPTSAAQRCSSCVLLPPTWARSFYPSAPNSSLLARMHTLHDRFCYYYIS